MLPHRVTFWATTSIGRSRATPLAVRSRKSTHPSTPPRSMLIAGLWRALPIAMRRPPSIRAMKRALARTLFPMFRCLPRNQHFCALSPQTSGCASLAIAHNSDKTIQGAATSSQLEISIPIALTNPSCALSSARIARSCRLSVTSDKLFFRRLSTLLSICFQHDTVDVVAHCVSDAGPNTGLAATMRLRLDQFAAGVRALIKLTNIR
jgi:hypothetical protein